MTCGVEALSLAPLQKEDRFATGANCASLPLVWSAASVGTASPYWMAAFGKTTLMLRTCREMRAAPGTSVTKSREQPSALAASRAWGDGCNGLRADLRRCGSWVAAKPHRNPPDRWHKQPEADLRPLHGREEYACRPGGKQPFAAPNMNVQITENVRNARL